MPGLGSVLGLYRRLALFVRSLSFDSALCAAAAASLRGPGIVGGWGVWMDAVVTIEAADDLGDFLCLHQQLIFRGHKSRVQQLVLAAATQRVSFSCLSLSL